MNNLSVWKVGKNVYVKIDGQAKVLFQAWSVLAYNLPIPYNGPIYFSTICTQGFSKISIDKSGQLLLSQTAQYGYVDITLCYSEK